MRRSHCPVAAPLGQRLRRPDVPQIPVEKLAVQLSAQTREDVISKIHDRPIVWNRIKHRLTADVDTGVGEISEWLRRLLMKMPDAPLRTEFDNAGTRGRRRAKQPHREHS